MPRPSSHISRSKAPISGLEALFTPPHRFGFNGKEKDDEVKGLGNSLDFGARVYDSRLGRFLSIDPKEIQFPSWSPYIFALNNPIKFIDVEGEGPRDGAIRMFTTRVAIGTGKNGKTQYMYFAKIYYLNQTNKAAYYLKKRAESVNGWYKITQKQYEDNQKNPKLVTTFGADTPSSENDISNQPISRMTPSEPEGVLIITVKAGETGKSIDYGYYDENDNKVSLGTKTVAPNDELTFNVEFNIPSEGALYIDQNESTGSVQASATTKAKFGDRAPDTMHLYGTEEPILGVDY